MNRKQRRAAAKQSRKAQQGAASIEDAIRFAQQLHQDHRFEDAETIYNRILEAQPDQADALHYLGVLQHQQGRSEEGVELIRKATGINPRYLDAHNNLGNVLKELGRLEEAEEAYRACLALKPKNPDALSNLGTVLREQGKDEDAVACYEKAIAIAPRHADAHHNMGNALKRLSRFEEAIKAYRTAIKINPSESATYRALGTLLHRAGLIDEALEVLGKWLEMEPDNAIAKHLYAACSGEDIPERASDDFVQATFDKFAGSFDKVLKRLEYHAPDLILAAVERHCTAPDGSLELLDAGCGTGLCGPLLRPYARHLVGVDLSPAMIDKAKGRGDYDELLVEELTGYIAGQPDRFDLIVSADTLCYFGALEEVIAASQAALRPGGRLFFSVEKMLDPSPTDTYLLQHHGRYCHAEAYVRRVVTENAFEILSLKTYVLRLEGSKPVDGLIVSLQKQATS